MSFDNFVATATGMGFALARVPYKEWVERVAAVARAEPDHPAAAVVPLLTARRGRSGLTMLELLAFRPASQPNGRCVWRQKQAYCPRRSMPR